MDPHGRGGSGTRASPTSIEQGREVRRRMPAYSDTPELSQPRNAEHPQNHKTARFLLRGPGHQPLRHSSFADGAGTRSIRALRVRGLPAVFRPLESSCCPPAWTPPCQCFPEVPAVPFVHPAPSPQLLACASASLAHSLPPRRACRCHLQGAQRLSV